MGSLFHSKKCTAKSCHMTKHKFYISSFADLSDFKFNKLPDRALFLLPIAFSLQLFILNQHIKQCFLDHIYDKSLVIFETSKAQLFTHPNNNSMATVKSQFVKHNSDSNQPEILYRKSTLLQCTSLNIYKMCNN